MNAMKKILVVDDEESIRLLIGRVLEGVAAEVTLADGPAQAARLLAGGAYDLILLDLLMPEEGGIQLLTRLRGMPDHRTTPVIIVSVISDPETRIVCQSLGVRDYVVKPFQRDALLNAVRAQLA
jgi:two-component system, NtrC family, response regulator AtoC